MSDSSIINDDALLPRPYTPEAIEIARRLYANRYRLLFKKVFHGTSSSPAQKLRRHYQIAVQAAGYTLQNEDLVYSHWTCVMFRDVEVYNADLAIGAEEVCRGSGPDTLSAFLDAYQELGFVRGGLRDRPASGATSASTGPKSFTTFARLAGSSFSAMVSQWVP